MIRKIIKFSIVVIVSIFISWIVGAAQDKIWLASDESISSCKTVLDSSKMPEGWKDNCLKIINLYDKGKFLFSFIGFILPFIGLYFLLR